MVEKYLFANNNGYVYTGKEILQQYEFQLDPERKPFLDFVFDWKTKKILFGPVFPTRKQLF